MGCAGSEGSFPEDITESSARTSSQGVNSMIQPYAIGASTVFDGAVTHQDCAVVIDGTTITAVLPSRDLPLELPVSDLPAGAWLSSGFIDLQVNGGGDVLFNDNPTPEGIAAIAAAHRQFGTTSLLPTLISDTPEKMRAALSSIGTASASDPGVLGIHFEGPFLSCLKAGVHHPSMIRPPSADDLGLLRAAGPGCVVVVTLAPEAVPVGFIRTVVDAGVHVCLGHSMSTYAQAKASILEGLTGFTHLFNAMRPLASRDPGPIAAALESPSVWFGMIVDGEHVDSAMLRLALRGHGHPMLVTDAMPPVGGTNSSFMLHGQEITVCAGRCTRSDGMLAGAALDMATAVRNSVNLLGLTVPDAIKLATITPAAFLGLNHTLGRVCRGYRADLVAFFPANMEIIATWVAGKCKFMNALLNGIQGRRVIV